MENKRKLVLEEQISAHSLIMLLVAFLWLSSHPPSLCRRVLLPPLAPSNRQIQLAHHHPDLLRPPHPHQHLSTSSPSRTDSIEHQSPPCDTQDASDYFLH